MKYVRYLTRVTGRREQHIWRNELIIRPWLFRQKMAWGSKNFNFQFCASLLDKTTLLCKNLIKIRTEGFNFDSFIQTFEELCRERATPRDQIITLFAACRVERQKNKNAWRYIMYHLRECCNIKTSHIVTLILNLAPAGLDIDLFSTLRAQHLLLDVISDIKSYCKRCSRIISERLRVFKLTNYIIMINWL